MTILPSGRKGEALATIGILAIGLAFVVAIMVSREGWWRWLSLLLWLPIIAAPASLLLVEPRRIEISEHGMTWSGLGWRRRTPWSAFAEIGTYRHELGTGGIWLAGRLTTDARASSRLYPRRLVTTSLSSTWEVAGLIRLTQPTWLPGMPGRRKPRTSRPAWDIPDEEIIDAVHARARDLWVGEIVAPPT